MLSMQLNQIYWEDQKARIVHQIKHTQGLKRNRNYLFTWKNMKDCYLAVRGLEMQYLSQLQNINHSSANGEEEPSQLSTSGIENCSEWDGLNARGESHITAFSWQWNHHFEAR